MSIIIRPTEDDLVRKEVLRGGATGVPDEIWDIRRHSGTTGLVVDAGDGGC
jgi:hypothetical protein